MELAAEQKHQDALKSIDDAARSTKMDAISGALGDIGSLMSSQNKKIFEIGKAGALAQAIIDGFSAEQAILQSSRRRLRPIVMTALATLAGMLPLSFALGAGSQMLQPLAIAVIGGVVISMVLSLIITPAVHFFATGGFEESTSVSGSQNGQ